jgi:hypothetical protein
MTIGALVLLGVFMLSANGLMVDNTRLAEQNEYCLTSLSIAQSIIDEAKSKSFDEATLTQTVTLSGGLTPPGLLGPESPEFTHSPDTSANGLYGSSQAFDDVDDYNGYVRQASTKRVEGFTARVAVAYASPVNPDSISSSRTFCKRMTVTVTNKYMEGQVSLSYAFTN